MAGSLAIFLVIAHCGCATRGVAPAAPVLEQKVALDADLLREFSERVDSYVTLHKRLKAGLPPLKSGSDPAAIAEHQQRLANAIRTARKDARPGDIFSERIRPLVLRIVHAELSAPGGAATRTAILEDSPTAVAPAINALYPPDAPLGLVPPALLLKLPALPEELEYRFANRHLVLRDTVANLVVDLVPGVLP